MAKFTVQVKALHPYEGWKHLSLDVDAKDAKEAKTAAVFHYSAPYSHFQVMKVEGEEASKETSKDATSTAADKMKVDTTTVAAPPSTPPTPITDKPKKGL